jgi:hypothetical protein
MFLIYELFLGLSRGEETFVFGKCYGFTHDHPWIEPPRRSFFPPSFSNIALLPLVARTLEMGLRAQIPLDNTGFLLLSRGVSSPWSVSSNDWGLYGFVQMLEYKCVGYGKELYIINTFSYV